MVQPIGNYKIKSREIYPAFYRIFSKSVFNSAFQPYSPVPPIHQTASGVT